MTPRGWDEDVVVEGVDGGGDADNVLEVVVPAVVEVGCLFRIVKKFRVILENSLTCSL